MSEKTTFQICDDCLRKVSPNPSITTAHQDRCDVCLEWKWVSTYHRATSETIQQATNFPMCKCGDRANELPTRSIVGKYLEVCKECDGIFWTKPITTTVSRDKVWE